MNYMRICLIAGLSAAALMTSMRNALATTVSAGSADGPPHIVTELLFKSTIPSTSTIAKTSTTASTQALIPATEVGNPGWVLGSQNGGSIGVASTPGPDGNLVNALEGSYPAGDAGQSIWVDYSLASLQSEDIYIEFWAKMPGATGGEKFAKIFGQNSSGNYANATFGTDYTGIQPGAMLQVSFGDGTSVANDSQNVIKLDGSSPSMIGRSYGGAVVQTPQMSGFSSTDWGTGWHHFLIHAKFNSGTTTQNEVANGRFFLEIDGKVYEDATGLFNRNPANGPIDRIELFGWAQNNPQPFQLWYYDVRISTGGFMPESPPNPPGNVGIK